MSRRDGVIVEAMRNEQSVNRKHTEELRLTNDVEEIKSKLREFESLLKQVSYELLLVLQVSFSLFFFFFFFFRFFKSPLKTTGLV